VRADGDLDPACTDPYRQGQRPCGTVFRTIREDLLQALPGYKGPDVHSRGLRPEADAHFYLDELEAIIREWVAVVYHLRPHDGLVDPHLPGLQLSPAAMFAHGIARAGYIEVPKDPDLAYEFLKTEWRTIQHYGVQLGGGRRYNGAALNPYRNMQSPYQGKRRGLWPVHYHPDDISRVYFRDPQTKRWYTLMWEHADALTLPLNEDALKFGRRLAARKYKYPNDKLAMAELLERWQLGVGQTLVERRIALRMAREDALLADVDDSPSMTPVPDEPPLSDKVAQCGSVGRDSEVEAIPAPDEPKDVSDQNDPDDPGDFYADALEDA
jgi:Mu transposase, C-terminal